MSKKWIESAIEEIIKGNPARARRILRAYVDRHPGDEEGWYWLSRVAHNRAEEVACLKQQWELHSSPSAEHTPATHPAPPLNASSTQPQTSSLRRILHLAAYALVSAFICVMAATVVPMFWGNRTIVITSGSMAPAIQAGSAVVVETVPSGKLQIGDVIAYSSENSAIPVVHRIIAIREEDGVRFYTSQGDANPNPDIAEFTLPQNAWRMWYAVPLAGYLIAFVGRPEGTFLLVFLPALFLIALKIVETIKRNRSIRPAPVGFVKQF
jgi:signal peptidase